MNVRLVRQCLYPLQERLLRRPTFALLGQLEASQGWSRGRLGEMQAEKLAAMLAHATRTIPYYAKTLSGWDEASSARDPRAALAELPTIDRSTLRDHLEEMSTKRVAGGARLMTTGGSTGEPVAFYVDRRREAFDKAARMRSHRWFGVEPGDREVYLWGSAMRPRHGDHLRALRDRILNERLLSAFALSADAVARYARVMEHFRPACVFGYPSSIELFCTLALDRGISLPLPSIRAVFVTGELCDARQRERIESFFGAPMADGYGGRDSGFCAHQCPAGSMHVTSEHVIVEILNDDGNVLPTGEEGEITVTNLDNFATPLIRYRTGDLGRLSDRACECGRGLEILEVTGGRKTDQLVSQDGTFRHALSLIYPLRDMPFVRRFQVRQRGDRSVDLYVAPRGPIKTGEKEQLVGAVRECLGVTLPVRLHVVDDIGQLPSGKFRFVQSDAANAAGEDAISRHGRSCRRARREGPVREAAVSGR